MRRAWENGRISMGEYEKNKNPRKILGFIITSVFFIWILFGCVLIYLFDFLRKDIRDTKRDMK